jgi:hypothetical protein
MASKGLQFLPCVWSPLGAMYLVASQTKRQGPMETLHAELMRDRIEVAAWLPFMWLTHMLNAHTEFLNALVGAA